MIGGGMFLLALLFRRGSTASNVGLIQANGQVSGSVPELSFLLDHEEGAGEGILLDPSNHLLVGVLLDEMTIDGDDAIACLESGGVGGSVWVDLTYELALAPLCVQVESVLLLRVRLTNLAETRRRRLRWQRNHF